MPDGERVAASWCYRLRAVVFRAAVLRAVRLLGGRLACRGLLGRGLASRSLLGAVLRAVVFLAAVLRAGAFLAVGLAGRGLLGRGLASRSLLGRRSCEPWSSWPSVLRAVVFFAAVLRAGAFLAGAFFTAFFAAVFLAAVFFAVVFLAAVFWPGFRGLLGCCLLYCHGHFLLRGQRRLERRTGGEPDTSRRRDAHHCTCPGIPTHAGGPSNRGERPESDNRHLPPGPNLQDDRPEQLLHHVFHGAPGRLRRLGHRMDELRPVHVDLLSDT